MNITPMDWWRESYERGAVWGGRSCPPLLILILTCENCSFVLSRSKAKSKAAGEGARPTQDALERVNAGDALPDDQGVDVVRAFVGLY